MSKISRSVIFSKSKKSNAKKYTGFGIGGLGHRGVLEYSIGGIKGRVGEIMPP